MNGCFCGSCKPGFSRSHVGTFRDHGSASITIADHRLPACIRYAYNQVMLL